MVSIQSVTGPVEGSDLGLVLVHEHVQASSPGILRTWPELYGGRDNLRDLAAGILARAKADGVSTMVDATTFDLGRDVELLAEVSALSGVTILASTGHWLDPSVTLAVRTAEQLGDLFTRELTEGTDGTGIRASVIKVASQETITPFEERVLVGAARASRRTNAPILTHTAALHRIGEKQAAVLETHGVDPSRVAIGHSDDSPAIDYLVGLARRGYWLSMDRISSGALPEYGPQTVDDRLRMIARLFDLGCGDRLLLSHDEPFWAGVLTEGDQQRHRDTIPDVISFIPRIALPALRKLGVTEDAITAMTIVNPRRWLTGGD
jgi:phosphotriesterase-related protein